MTIRNRLIETLIIAAAILFVGVIVRGPTAIACEIGGCGFSPYKADLAADRRAARLNQMRMLLELEDCEEGLLTGAVCHGYCRGDVYRFDRAKYCDAYDNFKTPEPKGIGGSGMTGGRGGYLGPCGAGTCR